VSELIVTRVDGQGVVSVSLAVEDMAVSYVGGHGVVVCSVERYRVLPLLVKDAELTASCVD